MYLLEIEALDLGADVRAVALELTEADENREPVRGADAARIWAACWRRRRRASRGRWIFSATWIA